MPEHAVTTCREWGRILMPYSCRGPPSWENSAQIAGSHRVSVSGHCQIDDSAFSLWAAGNVFRADEATLLTLKGLSRTPLLWLLDTQTAAVLHSKGIG